MQPLTSSNAVLMAVPQEQKPMQWSVVILRRDDAEVLVSGHTPPYRLPTVEIPVQQRIAPNLLPRIDENFGLRTVGRFSLTTEPPHPGTRCVVFDALDSNAVPLVGHVWLPVTAICREDFAPDAGAALESALARVHAYATAEMTGRFVGPGWLEEVRDWTAKSLTGSGLRLGTLSSQHNLGPDSALLRFATSGSAIWFKAVGSRCAREYAVTRILAEAGVPHISQVVELREDWRAWLSVEAVGKHPDNQTERTDWEIAARSLSQLQIESIPHTGALLRAGARDFRPEQLCQAIEPCLSRLSALMQRQPSVPPPMLGTEEFRSLEKQLRTACRRLGALGVPATVGHSDFSSGNILIGGGNATFLDWAESHVGPPFMTLAYLELLADSVQSRFCRKAYLDLWRSQCSPKQIEALLSLTHLLAVFAYVLACDQPLQPPEDLSPELARYLRSLARRMQLEAQNFRDSVLQ